MTSVHMISTLNWSDCALNKQCCHFALPLLMVRRYICQNLLKPISIFNFYSLLGIMTYFYIPPLFSLVLFYLLLFLKNLIKLFIYLFIFGCRGSLLLCVGFPQLQRTGATLRCSARASHCCGFSCCRARTLGTQASVVVACGLSSCGLQALEHRLSSCGTQAQLLCGMWDLPGPGLEPVSPALAGRFLTTAPPGKPLIDFKIRVRIFQLTIILFIFIFCHLSKR